MYILYLSLLLRVRTYRAQINSSVDTHIYGCFLTLIYVPVQYLQKPSSTYNFFFSCWRLLSSTLVHFYRNTDTDRVVLKKKNRSYVSITLQFFISLYIRCLPDSPQSSVLRTGIVHQTRSSYFCHNKTLFHFLKKMLFLEIITYQYS